MKRWNIFARELEDILATQGLGLGHLDDRAFIHREKVRRLKHSLLRPKSFPVLNPAEMDEVISVFRLTNYEVLRLRAALLATSLEEMLMGRIQQDEALMAAEQCFPILLNALLTDSGDASGLGAVRVENGVSYEDTDDDKRLEATFAVLDRATIALQLANTFSAQEQYLMYMWQAHRGFKMALAELERVVPESKATEAWQACYQEALAGLLATTERQP